MIINTYTKSKNINKLKNHTKIKVCVLPEVKWPTQA